ncbi:MAG: hypothetical protein JSU63_06110 [Phycisphaerales bacterium]|nr:MAG: hypothetical protein JSU63_06110 [Phycisphaerales bacterium]
MCTDLPARVVAVCVSQGGIPKQPVPDAEVTVDGLLGDGQEHEVHHRTDRAVSLQDLELLEELKGEGYPVGPGSFGENVTVQGVNVQRLAPGDRLHLDGGPVLELTVLRTTCSILGQVHPEIPKIADGKCGVLAKVLRTGRVFPGQGIVVERAAGKDKPQTE